jgi:hypothetical protein
VHGELRVHAKVDDGSSAAAWQWQLIDDSGYIFAESINPATSLGTRYASRAQALSFGRIELA